MIHIDDKLTESQLKAVNHKTGPLLVLAGPGSGKTRVITSRIAALIESGVRPYNICAITFTNKAAEEMRQRLFARNIPAGVKASTFHSLCVWILRLYGDQAGIKSNFSIYDDSDQKRVVKEAIKICDLDSTNFPPSKMLEGISRCKNDIESPQELSERAVDYYSKSLAKVYAAYQDTLDSNNALDFDDLLMKVALLLRDFPEVRQRLSDQFRYLLVDEYQDTNHAQYQIAKGLALAHGNICVTGDPDQSIYRWRGADIGNILAFEKDWPTAEVVRLEENFRSTPEILSLADKLIANNTNRKQKHLIATLPSGEPAKFTQYDDAEHESQSVADSIKMLLSRNVDPNEVAVFYRVNSMSRQIEEALVRKQLPYQVVRGVEFYSRKEIRDLLSYLKLIANPDDNSAFLRAIGTHPRGIGKTTMDRLSVYADSNNISLLSAAQKAALVDGINKPTQGRLAGFAAMIAGFIDESKNSKVAELMETVLEDSGLLESLKNQDVSDIENVTELINAASKYDEQAETSSLVDYLQSIALYSDTDAYDESSGKVSLMSLHAAKGLEFDHVFIIGLEEGLLPHDRSINGSPDELEEERRLFFVGITRARKRLSISTAKHRVIRGQFLRTTPSRFLYEIDAIEKERYHYDTEFAQQSYDDDAYTPPVKKQSKQPEYVPGQVVQHKKFGIGRVKEFKDMGENSIVVVRFNSGQTKTLLLAYANLTRLG